MQEEVQKVNGKQPRTLALASISLGVLSVLVTIAISIVIGIGLQQIDLEGTIPDSIVGIALLISTIMMLLPTTISIIGLILGIVAYKHTTGKRIAIIGIIINALDLAPACCLFGIVFIFIR